MTWIENTVRKLVAKHQTADPFELADYLNIIIIKEPLGKIRGYYQYYLRNKIIHLNSDLKYWEQRKVLAHELGHAVLHTKLNTPFMQMNTFCNVSRYEREACEFGDIILRFVEGSY